MRSKDNDCFLVRVFFSRGVQGLLSGERILSRDVITVFWNTFEWESIIKFVIVWPMLEAYCS